MGYRSDLTAIFYPQRPENYAAIKLWVQENVLNLGVVRESAEVNFHEGNRYKDTIEIKFESIKWYDDFPDVVAFEKALVDFGELFDSEDSGVCGCYELAEIGEDLADLRHEHSPSAEWYLGIRRAIELT